MATIMPSNNAAANVVVACEDLSSALDFYTGELNFRIDLIFPADSPRLADLSGHGVRLRLERGNAAATGTADGEWVTGRAGMQYRDLVPDRLGGRVIASHIRIPDGGTVPDYVHHHDIDFQLIYCYKGWVRVVYEDQGEPIVMHPGDCVLQPPHIRHRVLECSDGMEVVEVTSPAEHETLVDHEMELPTVRVDPGRDFGGQRFVFHECAAARWAPGPFEGMESIETGIADATGGLASVLTLRPAAGAGEAVITPVSELCFSFVLEGSANLQLNAAGPRTVRPGDAFVVPADGEARLIDMNDELHLLNVVSDF
jgi:quercetin dioxygenase-like cupin family protein